MMRARVHGLMKGERGQAATEMALVTPLMIWMILGILQMTLMHQARLMLDYAAFVAARAGSVWHGDPARMNSAAMFAILPTMPTAPIGPKKPQRVDTWTGLGKSLIFTKVLQNVFPIINVETLNPTKSDFSGGQEIEFDNLANRMKTQLVIRVVYNYELRIPFANMIMWESWYAVNAGIRLTGLDPSNPKMNGIKDINFKTRVAIESGSVKDPNCKFTGLKKNDLIKLAGWAGLLHRYYIPMVATYTMRMQSNPYQKYAPKKKGC